MVRRRRRKPQPDEPEPQRPDGHPSRFRTELPRLDWAPGGGLCKRLDGLPCEACHTGIRKADYSQPQDEKERAEALSRTEVSHGKSDDEKSMTLSDVDMLRVRLWRARASHSRGAGLALVILSAALFAGAFFTSSLLLEIASVASFVIGVALLAYEAEARVKLFPAMSSLIGPLKVVEKELKQHRVSKAKAVFTRSVNKKGTRDVMNFVDGGSSDFAHHYTIPPLGDGLVQAYELELGDLTK